MADKGVKRAAILRFKNKFFDSNSDDSKETEICSTASSDDSPTIRPNTSATVSEKFMQTKEIPAILSVGEATCSSKLDVIMPAEEFEDIIGKNHDIFFNADTNEIQMRSHYFDYFNSSREYIVLKILDFWRYICLFIATAVVGIELLDYAIDYRTYVPIKTLIQISNIWTAVSICVSVFILLLEIVYRALGYSTNDLCLKFSSPEYEIYTKRDVLNCIIKAWKPVAVICAALLVLLVDIIIRLYASFNSERN